MQFLKSLLYINEPYLDQKNTINTASDAASWGQGQNPFEGHIIIRDTTYTKFPCYHNHHIIIRDTLFCYRLFYSILLLTPLLIDVSVWNLLHDGLQINRKKIYQSYRPAITLTKQLGARFSWVWFKSKEVKTNGNTILAGKTDASVQKHLTNLLTATCDTRIKGNVRQIENTSK